jgi:hypothetical protein
MAIELSNIMFTNQDDIVPRFGREQIVNTGIANTLAGNDIITGDTGNSISSLENKFSGVSNRGMLNTADGNDIIIGIGNSISGTGNSLSGIYNNGTLNTGGGNDIIRGIRNQGEDNFNDYDYDFGYGIYTEAGSTIDTGDGNDLITGISQARTGRGIETYYGTINTGDGNDTIAGTGNGYGISIHHGGIIDTRKGNDIIAGIATDYGDGIGNFSTLDTGEGNDTITGTNTTGSGYGINNYFSHSTIDTGEGNDIITGRGGMGINNDGTINTGNGADLIIADGGFKGVGSVFLGNGKDYLKGFGSGNFNGGNDKDALELTSGSYTVGISGTAVNLTKDSIIMNTSEFEILIAGSKTYNFASLTAGQTIVVA